MNFEIIPAINSQTREEVESKMRLIEPHVRWVHLDVADGTFTKNTLWHNAADLFATKISLNVEVHLMVENPEAVIDAWIGAGAKRIITHVETIKDFDYLKKRCDEAKVFLMLSITPRTSWTQLVPYMKQNVVSFQVLSVHPGLAGQEFIGEGIGDSGQGIGTAPAIESSYDKIRHIREHCSYCDIEVDGGVKLGVAKLARNAGANLFAAASAIFNAPDIKKAVEDLKYDVSGDNA